MNQIRLRKLGKLAYGDPRGFLVELRNIEAKLDNLHISDRVRRLRTNDLKPSREMRDAALFCVGISEKFNIQVRFAPVEDDDFDFVATCVADDIQHFVPVQLKEVAPDDLNPNSSILDILETLSKYSNPRDLIIAIRLNRAIRFDPALIRVPESLRFGGLWVYGCISEDQSKWAIWGDFMATSVVLAGTAFDYPT